MLLVVSLIAFGPCLNMAIWILLLTMSIPLWPDVPIFIWVFPAEWYTMSQTSALLWLVCLNMIMNSLYSNDLHSLQSSISRSPSGCGETGDLYHGSCSQQIFKKLCDAIMPVRTQISEECFQHLVEYTSKVGVDLNVKFKYRKYQMYAVSWLQYLI